ncbi:MAG: NAD(P)-binding domain-containing protein [Archangiaceae bacterium]|nr:NAD(P)-binding domain-containing protein [Archangiaceae bacterium]
MKVGVLGTGVVGQAIATRLVQLGHEVCMGARNSDNEKARAFEKQFLPKGTSGTFSDAAAFGELLFNCTNGAGALDALKAAGEANLAGKVLIDISNPLDFSNGFPPSMLTPSTDSLAEQVQRAFPRCLVVKSLNTVTAKLMVEPQSLSSGNHDMFMAGNDAGAKAKVKELLQSFGWKHIVDVGDITGARGLEMYLPLWVRLYGQFQTATFNVKVVR